jgi:threonylcarbamoyladenosine tRNA methylthiotransferase MtaB
MTTVALETLGCKLNQAESEALARELLAAGFQLVSPEDVADVHILNTCTVTHVADRKARHLLRLARRRNPRALLVVAGCYAERAPEELRHVEVDMVVGKEGGGLTLAERLGAARLGAKESTDCGVDGLLRPDDIWARNDLAKEGLGPSKTPFRTRSIVKVQDGCDDFCAYCIVPRVRGREHSLPTDRVVGEVSKRVEDGYKEVVLTGTKIGSYRYMGVDLKGLLERLLAETGIARVRLSSLQPREMTPGLLALWESPRLCRHFHLSLQSGSAETLSRMGRGYSIDEYKGTLASIREAVPGAAITTDVIVGFPGETVGEFEESYGFCQEMAFANIHVFPYSSRSGTLAAAMPGRVTEPVKRERKERMLRLARESAGRFRERYLGQRAWVLWEGEEKGLCSGLTENYIRVLAPGPALAVNEVTQVRLVGQGEGYIRGEPLHFVIASPHEEGVAISSDPS